MSNIIVTLTLLAAASTTQAPAAQPQTQPQAPQLRALLQCRAVIEAEARLRCYDAAAAAFAQATNSGAVVVMDQQAIRKARRSIFGLPMPDLPFLGGGGDEESSEIKASIRSAQNFDYGKWRITLDDGAVWETTQPDTRSRQPRAGDSVTIRKGSLGSYRISWPGGRGAGVKRIR